MSSEWPLRTLDSLATEVTVGFVGTMADEYVANGVPFLRSLNVNPFLINTNDLKFIKPEFHAKIKKSALHPGDVVIVRTGKPGTCAVIPDWLEDANCSDLVITRCGPELRPRFLCYWVNSVAAHHVSSHLVGAVQQHFNVGAAKTMMVAAPSLKVQDQVVSVLGALDDRITLLSETNATLEAIAQALFKSWFVDFDPVHARARGEQPEGIPEPLAALFPNSFEDSALGLVPRGWRVGTIADLTSVKGGFAYKSSDFSNSGSPVLKIKNIVGDGTVDVSDTQRINQALAEKTNRFALVDGDILMAMTGATIGKVGVVVTHNDEMPYLNQRVAKFEDKLPTETNSWLIFTAFQNAFMINQIINAASGSAQPNISAEGIESAKLILPSNNEVLRAFDDSVSPLFSVWINNHKQTQTLATLRDTLLPRLISGQLRLPDAEALAQEA